MPPWVALWTVVFAVAYGTNVPTPLLLLYRDTLGLTPTSLTGAFGVYAAGLVPALLLAGPASDRLGRPRVVVPFVLLTALGSVIWNSLLVGAGYALGTQYDRVEQYMGYLDYVIYAAVIVIVVWFVVRKIRQPRRPASGRHRA